MNTTEAIEILTEYNKWRRGAEIKHPNPKKIGEAIDIAVAALVFMQDSTNDEITQSE